MPKPIPAALPPHSWRTKDWPPFVYPGNCSSGKRIVWANQDTLVRLGALARCGRELVVFGGPYVKWLQSQGDRVSGYDLPANRPQHASKRGRKSA